MSWFGKIENKQKISSRLLVHIHQSRSARAYAARDILHSKQKSVQTVGNEMMMKVVEVAAVAMMVVFKAAKYAWWYKKFFVRGACFCACASVRVCVCVFGNLLERLSIYYLPGSFHLEWLVMKHNSTFKMAVKSYTLYMCVSVRWACVRAILYIASNTQPTTNCKRRKKDSVNEWKMGNDNEKFDWFYFLVRVLKRRTHTRLLWRRRRRWWWW